MNRLDPIVAATREEVARRREVVPPAEVGGGGGAAGCGRSDVRDFAGALARPGLSVIAEHKRRSPSAGLIREDLGSRTWSGRTSAAAPRRCRS